MRSRVIAVLMVLWAGSASAAEIVDATGRTVQVPDHVAHVVPAGPPASVLLEAIAPDLMAGWPEPVPQGSRDVMAPAAAGLGQVPRVTGREDVSAAIKALKPDLIVDYGTVSPRFADGARATQERTGVPTILLDGSMAKIPQTLRALGAILHREARAEVLATFAEAMLALPVPAAHPKVLYARGADGLLVAAPDTDVTEVFKRLGWQVVAPEGKGTFRTASIEAIKALDPDMVVFADPAMRAVVERSADWKTVRAVREGHVLVSPGMPFGWVEEPPSINRLAGLAWLSGRDPVTVAAVFNAVFYGHALTAAELDTVLAGVRPVQP
jgi:iron complex transport system substrate-binding protein